MSAPKHPPGEFGWISNAERHHDKRSGTTRDGPLVSVVVSFLDGERFLNEAVGSVLAQTYTNWEILAVDDGSSDSSTAMVQEWAVMLPSRVRYFDHPGHANLGLSVSRNLGVAKARGKYLAFLDADDVYLPTKLERQVAVLESHPEAVMVCGPLHFWYGWTGDPVDARADFVCRIGGTTEGIASPPELLIRQLKTRDGLPGVCSVLIRPSALQQVGGFEEDFGFMYEDEAFFAKLAVHFPIYVMTEPLDLYRQHPDSCCARAAATGDYDMNPSVPNPARGRFLDWLEKYLDREDIRDCRLREALAQQLVPYRLAPPAGAGC